MAVPVGNVPLKEQYDNTAALTVALTTKPVVGLQALNCATVAAIVATATSIQIQLPESSVPGNVFKNIPSWLNASCVYRIAAPGIAPAASLQELLTVTGVVIANNIATLTCTATTNAYPAGTTVEIQQSVGAAAAATFTFAAQALNTANRGMILELCDLLDRALREGAATVA